MTRRLPLLFALLLTVVAAPHARAAAGMGLRWGSCEGTSNRNFACDRATGKELLVGSFSPPAGISELTGIEVYMRITSSDANVPAWWRMAESGACRQRSIAVQLDVSDEMECDDPWEGRAMGGIARFRPGSNGLDVVLGIAIPQEAKHALQSGQRYAAFKLHIDHQRSTGPGSCEGCTQPVCIVWERLVIAQATRPDPLTKVSRPRTSEVTTGLPASGGVPGNLATWQGGTPTCGAGLAKPSSWSQIKDRFRTR